MIIEERRIEWKDTSLNILKRALASKEKRLELSFFLTIINDR
jgi:hypothetical protein